MYWKVVQLQPPPKKKKNPPAAAAETYSMGLGPSKLALTEWIGDPPDADDVVPEPGVHYRVNENALASNTNYVIYPETETLATFRHCWIMERSKRPRVPSPTNTPMPDREPHEEDRARLFSIFLRPWVLERADASVSVPHITDLDKPLPRAIVIDEPGDECVKRRKLSTKTTADGSRSYKRAWATYVRGRIVSMHARRLIVQFMAACCGKSSRHEGNETQRGREPDDEERSTPNELKLQEIHGIIRDTARKHEAAVDLVSPSSVADGSTAPPSSGGQPSRNVLGGLQLSASLWGIETAEWHGGLADTTGTLPRNDEADTRPTHGNAGRSETQCADIPGKAWVRLTEQSATKWLAKVDRETPRPVGKQREYLEAVIARCQQMAAEDRKSVPKSKRNSEPMRCALLGIPGAGKTECIKWQIQFFKECLGWEHGVHFQCLASQHTMAALFGGTTVHGWGQVPIDLSKAHELIGRKKGAGGPDTLFERAQSIEWLIIDEISTLACLVCGVFNSNLERARKRHPRSHRPNGEQRPFGGINVTVAGDWWQLPPVRAAGFYSNPFGELEGVEQRAMQFFWFRDEDCFSRLFELTEPHRQRDKWFLRVLMQHRYGREDWETYCFQHGLPTLHTGSWLPPPECRKPACRGCTPGHHCSHCKLDALTCKNARCFELVRTVWPNMAQAQKSWRMRASLECEDCKAERRRRCCVAIAGNHNEKKHLDEAFAVAPYIHPFNYPKYHAQQLRSILFAKAKHRRLLWVRAHDWPIADGDEELTKEDLARLRHIWLQYHDKATAGIMGLLPLVYGLPMRLTDTEDASRQAYKNARCTLVGWTLSAAEEARINERRSIMFLTGSEST